MTGFLRRTLRWINARPTRLRDPGAVFSQRREELEQVLHDGPALRASSLALELALISMSANDPSLRARIDTAQTGVQQMLDELRNLGERLYPPVLRSSGIESAVRTVAEKQRVLLTLDVLSGESDLITQSRACLLIADHLRSLRPGTAATVKVRGSRKFVRVSITHQVQDQPEPKRHWAVIRCG
ncbi:hypothetical protein GCM10022267_75780 [Lentzea roselyniae]|uniref:Signal transduction histidine kinase subgroup 3 dimerisation and phosphoacceptor domain-containing protein n=1 Tax=Lentzea roselyniae TaxID=531940 RepID=A0ABP7C676_9PSEU